MSGIFGFVDRLWAVAVGPKSVAKKEGALKFGILGAANIAPMALINPAKTHPEVIIQAVAARDRAKATAYARKHGIPQVLDSYQAILDDPSIDCVYIPLPNGLHYEWALKALAKGKHVLLEKPSVSNGTEAEVLFRHPLLLKGAGSPKKPPPVLLEAVHYRFHPAWSVFMSLVDRANVESARSVAKFPRMMFADDDIRFNYGLAGGAMMDLGPYPTSAVRLVFGEPPVECTHAELAPCPEPRGRCDEGFSARFRFPNGGTGEAVGTLRGTVGQIFTESPPRLYVVHRPVVVPPDSNGVLSEGQELVKVRKLYLSNFMGPSIYHRIDVEDEFTVREKGAAGAVAGVDSGKVIKKWTEKSSKKAYTWKEAGFEGRDENPAWPTYTYQLWHFVDRVKGRQGTGLWVDPEDSIAQSKMLDMAYEKSGFGARPGSDFVLQG